MLKNLKSPKDIRDAMLSLLPTCGTLAGIAIGLVSFINYRQGGGSKTIADEVLLVSALGFLLACYCIFFAMRSGNEHTLSRLLQAIDILFLSSLTLVVFAGFAIVYELI